MAYIEVKAPAGVSLPPGATSVSIQVTAAFKIDDGTPDPTMTGFVQLGSMNPDFCEVPQTIIGPVPPGGTASGRVIAIPVKPQFIGGQWVCDLMISAQTPDGVTQGGSALVRIYGVPAPPQPTTKLVQVRSQGQLKGGPVPIPFDVLVDGQIVYTTNPQNPITPAGGGWGSW